MKHIRHFGDHLEIVKTTYVKFVKPLNLLSGYFWAIPSVPFQLESRVKVRQTLANTIIIIIALVLALVLLISQASLFLQCLPRLPMSCPFLSSYSWTVSPTHHRDYFGLLLSSPSQWCCIQQIGVRIPFSLR